MAGFRGRLLEVALALGAIVSGLSGCTGPGSLGAGYALSIQASTGTLSGTGTHWTFDAGTIPRYATETITFTLNNTGGEVFFAEGSVSFTGGDFATDIEKTLTVQPGLSRTIAGTFTPTGAAGRETGTLVLTPAVGDPIVIDLTGTSDESFVLVDPGGSRVTNVSAAFPVDNMGTPYEIANNGSATITLTGGPDYLLFGTDSGVYAGTPVSSPTIGPKGSDVFTIYGFASCNGLTYPVTISGTDSATGAPFTFTFLVLVQVPVG